MEIQIDTRHHCIETGSKKEYEQLISRYLHTGLCKKEKILLEQQIEALAYFLSNADFSDLRNRYHALGSSNKEMSVLVIPKALGAIYIRIDQKIMYPVWKKNQY